MCRLLETYVQLWFNRRWIMQIHSDTHSYLLYNEMIPIPSNYAKKLTRLLGHISTSSHGVTGPPKTFDHLLISNRRTQLSVTQNVSRLLWTNTSMNQYTSNNDYEGNHFCVFIYKRRATEQVCCHKFVSLLYFIKKKNTRKCENSLAHKHS